MKKTLLMMTLLFGTFTSAFSQTEIKVRTTPKLPARESLERMNLTLAWHARVSVDGNRDGIASIQVLPGRPNQLVVQTLKGMVYLYDADNGDLIWKTTIGVLYWASQPVSFNSQSIFVTRRNVLHVLNRADGTQRVFTYDPASKTYTFGYELAFSPSAAPMADEEFLYVPMSNRVHAIYIPDFEAIEKTKLARKKQRDAKKDERGMPGDDDIPDSLDSPQPDFYWGYGLGDQVIRSSPLINGEQLSILTTDGTLTAVNRYGQGPRIEKELFKTKGLTPAAPAQHLNTAYLASDDFNLYAVNMKSGELEWRHISGAPLLQTPYLNDRDIYIAPQRVGLRRVDRVKGREVWTNRDASRFLAANLSYVYAMDRLGKFFVIDAKRGTTLAKTDFADWTIPVANEWTDRVYLAANDGKIMCLRNRDLPKALSLKTQDLGRRREEMNPAEEKKKGGKDKDKEKDKDIEKDKDKEKDKDMEKDKDKEKARDKDAAELDRPLLQTRLVEMFARNERPAVALGTRNIWTLR
jgi:outer membrane protein assembly factor BamB